LPTSQQLPGNCREVEKLCLPILPSIHDFTTARLLLSSPGVTVKIETIRNADGTIIRLIGRLEGECLPELKDQIETGGQAIVLEMDEAMLVDREMVRFLVDCQDRGIEVRGCSPYIREWMAREREGDA
jgi:hypothetical protein